MADRPHDVTDLYLAPVLLAIDTRIEELGKLDKDGLPTKSRLRATRAITTKQLRQEALITTITTLAETHHWEFPAGTLAGFA